METQINKRVFTAILSVLLASSSPLAAAQSTLQESREVQRQTQNAAIRSQQIVNDLDDETRQLLDEFRIAAEEHRQLTQHNEQLAGAIDNQRQALRSIESQLDDVQHTQQSIVPLMARMVARLEQFVTLDLPFLMRERSDRIAALSEILDDAEIVLPEKYRRIMEAYQIELDYGRTIETYQDTIALGDKELTVNVFRLGRLGLYCLTLDNRQAGMYDRFAHKWVNISGSFRDSLEYAIRMARKQAPPDLIELPVPTPDAGSKDARP